MAQKNPESNMDELRSLLKSGAVKRVLVLRVPDAVMTRVDVTPQALGSIASYTVTFREDIEATFEPLLAGLSFKKEKRNPDLRWGVLFYDAHDQELGSLYVDKFGQEGYLNGETVVFETGLLESNVAKRLRRIVSSLR
jgi:hypothetical protein